MGAFAHIGLFINYVIHFGGGRVESVISLTNEREKEHYRVKRKDKNEV